MKESHSHKVTNSVLEWIDHVLLYEGEAFQNKTGQFYYFDDEELPDSYNTFGSPYKQFVYDASVTGANMFTGVSVGATAYGSNVASGIYLDHVNGRILIPDSIINSSSVVSGSYAIKEFNTYVASEQDEEMIFDDTYRLSENRYGHVTESAANPYAYYAPACFIVQKSSANNPFSFGGQVDSVFKYRLVVVADSQYQLDGCLSLLRDQSNKNVAILNSNRLPLNEYGDLKPHFSGSYNYLDEVANCEGMIFVNSVSSAIVGSSSRDRRSSSLFVGFADFEFSSVRYV